MLENWFEKYIEDIVKGECEYEKRKKEERPTHVVVGKDSEKREVTTILAMT